MKIYRTLNRDFNDLFIFAFITRAMVKKDVWGNIRIVLFLTLRLMCRFAYMFAYAGAKNVRSDIVEIQHI